MRSAAWLFLPVFLTAAIGCSPASAQSEFLGDRFPYAKFDRLTTTPITVGGGTLNVGFAPGELALPRSAFNAWLEKSAKAVSVYFGKFPVASARVLIVPVSGSGVEGGTTFGYRGAAIRLVVSSDATEADLADDWKAVHEMTHLALPDVDETHLWLAEGIAVYVEPIARVQAGDLTAEKVWGDMVRDMKQGLPKKGDRGLDRTPTWGRTYWGGAIFCLLADVEIRQQTGNRIGCSKRCAASSKLAAITSRIGLSSASSASPTKPLASRSSPSSMRRCARSPMRQTSTRCGATWEFPCTTAG